METATKVIIAVIITLIMTIAILSLLNEDTTYEVDVVSVEFNNGEIIGTSDGETYFVDDINHNVEVGDDVFVVAEIYVSGRPVRGSERLIPIK